MKKLKTFPSVGDVMEISQQVGHLTQQERFQRQKYKQTLDRVHVAPDPRSPPADGRHVRISFHRRC